MVLHSQKSQSASRQIGVRSQHKSLWHPTETLTVCYAVTTEVMMRILWKDKVTNKGVIIGSGSKKGATLRDEDPAIVISGSRDKAKK